MTGKLSCATDNDSQPHTEEGASIEIINEEIERAVHGDTVRRTTK